MNPIDDALAAFADRSPPRLRYLIGVSGGRDSVALLDLLDRAGYKNLVVCHLNHGLRGRESGQDATFVRRLARRYSLPVEMEKMDVAHLATRAGLSLEDAGRRSRFAFFARASKKWRCRRVILAHHADDQIETVLMNLGRGSGSGGLRGMRSEVSMPVASDADSITEEKNRKLKKIPLTLLRPLLTVPRHNLESHIETHHLPYREDPSNTDPAHLRNRVRHQLIPSLTEVFQRDVRPAILRTASVGDEEDALLDQLAAEALSVVSVSDIAPDRLHLHLYDVCLPALDIPKFRTQHLALQRRVLYKWLTGLGVPDIRFRDIEAVRALIKPGSKSAKVNLPRDHHARRKSGLLFVTPPRNTR